MLRQLSVVLVLFLFLAGVVHYGSKIRITWLPETPEPHPPIPVALVQARTKLSLRQAATPALPRAAAAKPADAPVTSYIVATNSPSENPTAQTRAALEMTVQATTHSTPPASTDIHTPATTSTPHTPPTASTTHAAASITAATLGPATAPGSRPLTATPSDHTSVSSLSTLDHKTETRTQSSHRTALPATLSTRPHTSTASEVPAEPSPTAHNATEPVHTAEPTPTAHNATEPVHTAEPSPTAHNATEPVHTAEPTPTAHNTTHPTPSTSSAPGPTVAPQPSTVKTGTYQVLNGSRLCIKAEMGLELMVQALDSVFSSKSYFSIDPNTTQASGNCGFRNSNLLVNFPGGFVNLTFTKDENSYYISEVKAYLTISNPEKSYLGLKSSLMLFEAVLGHSFKCVSEQSVQLSRHLQLKVMNTQLQAFDFEGNHFGNADDCFSDTSRRETPVAVGLNVAALLAILLSACLVARKKPGGGYERM